MNFRKVILAVLIPLFLISMVGCSDDVNDGPPERIVSLSPGNTEILFALGLGDSIVGVTENCDYPPEARWKPVVGGFSNIDPELVMELDPDFVLASPIHAGTVIETLEADGIKVLKIVPETIDDVLMFISLTGVLTYREEEAAILRNDIEFRIEDITNKIHPSSPNIIPLVDRPRVFCLIWDDPPYSVGNDTLLHNLVRMAGGDNIFADASGYFQIDPEIVSLRDPEIIIAVTGHGTTDDGPYNWVLTEESLENTIARKNNRVYSVDADLILRPGPRIVDGLELVTKCIFPDALADVMQESELHADSFLEE